MACAERSPPRRTTTTEKFLPSVDWLASAEGPGSPLVKQSFITARTDPPALAAPSGERLFYRNHVFSGDRTGNVPGRRQRSFRSSGRLLLYKPPRQIASSLAKHSPSRRRPLSLSAQIFLISSSSSLPFPRFPSVAAFSLSGFTGGDVRGSAGRLRRRRRPRRRRGHHRWAEEDPRAFLCSRKRPLHLTSDHFDLSASVVLQISRVLSSSVLMRLGFEFNFHFGFCLSARRRRRRCWRASWSGACRRTGRAARPAAGPSCGSAASPTTPRRRSCASSTPAAGTLSASFPDGTCWFFILEHVDGTCCC